jgi:histidinol-phosphatase
MTADAPQNGPRYDEWLVFALACCDAADAIALEHFRRDLVIETKPDRTFVTQADTAIESAVRGLVTATYPGHGLVGEEYGTEEGTGTIRWYIDPIDGTHNFMRGVPLFGTLIAVEEDGEIAAGVMSAPAMGERWYARRGGGTWAVGSVGPDAGRPRRVGTSRVATIEDAHILYSSPFDIEQSGAAPGFATLVRSAWRDRGFGDFWGYALVAEGAAEAMVEVGPNSWDIAAPSIVVEEAGGRMTDISGVRTIHGGNALASNGILHDEIVARLRGPRPTA